MEELRAEVIVLNEKYKEVLNEIKKYENITMNLYVDSNAIKGEIYGMEAKIRQLLPDLTYDEKKGIKLDLDHIGKIISISDKSKLSIHLEEHSVKWHTRIEGSVGDMKIIICTNSDIVKHIVRKCFTQSEGCLCIEEDTEEKKMERLHWFNGRNSCCSELVEYDAEVLENLLRLSD
jgi:hypothetical protein